MIIIAIIVVATIGYLSWRYEQKRSAELRSWAARRSFRFRAAKDRNLARQYPDFKRLHRGHSRFVKNVMTGRRRDLEVTAFDYQYTTGHGKNRQTHRESAAIVRSAHPLIPLHIRHEHIFDKVGEFLGFDDIDFESAEFSRKFHVSSPDRKWAYDVLHNRTIEFLMKECFCDLDCDGWHVMIHRNRRFSPQEFGRAMDLAVGFLERIPDFVVRELTGGSSRPPGANRTSGESSERG
jgi:hypothetical protein